MPTQIKSETITGFLISAQGCQQVTLPRKNKLPDIYKMLDCRLVEVIATKLSNGKIVSVYCDEEAPFAQEYNWA